MWIFVNCMNFLLLDALFGEVIEEGKVLYVDLFIYFFFSQMGYWVLLKTLMFWHLGVCSKCGAIFTFGCYFQDLRFED